MEESSSNQSNGNLSEEDLPLDSRLPADSGDEADQNGEAESADLPETDNNVNHPKSLMRFDAPAKSFYESEFENHEKIPVCTKVGNGTRSRYIANCSKCGKKVTGIDTYWTFRHHCQSKHKDDYDNSLAEEKPDEEKNVSKVSPEDIVTTQIDVPYSEPVTSLAADRPSREFFERLYHSHEISRGYKRKDGRSIAHYAAYCKLCHRKQTGSDSYYLFRDHYRYKHPTHFLAPGSEDATAAATIEENDGDASAAGTSEPLSFGQPAKVFFTNFFDSHQIDKDRKDDGSRIIKKYSGVCKLCGKHVVGVDSFFGFRQHIRNKHRDLQIAAGTIEEAKTFIATGSVPQSSIVSTRENPAWNGVYPSNFQPDQNTLNRNVALCAAESLIPLAQLTLPCWSKLTGDLDGHIAWPSWEALATKHLPTLRGYLKDQIFSNLRKTSALSLVAYMWPLQGYFAVTARFIDTNWKIQNPILAAKRVAGQQSTNIVFKSIVSYVSDYDSDAKIVHVNAICCSDSEAVPSGHGDILSKDRKTIILCSKDPDEQPLADELNELLRNEYSNATANDLIENLVRSLEHVVDEAVNSTEPLQAVLKKVLAHPSLPHKAAPASGQLLPVWHPVLQRANAAMKNKWDSKLKPNSKPTASEMEQVRQFAEILQYFDEVFLKLNRKDMPAVCDVIPLLYGLRHSLTRSQEEFPAMSDFIQNLLEEIDTRFAGVDETVSYIAAAFLDPNYKLLWCKASPSASKEEDAKAIVLAQIAEISVENNTYHDDADESSLFEPPPKRPSLLSFLKNLSSSPQKSYQEESFGPSDEIDAYLISEDTNENPLEYWKQNGHRFKRLATLARNTLFLPVVNSHSTSLTTVINDRNLQTFDPTVEMISFCHVNLAFSKDYCGKRKRNDND